MYRHFYFMFVVFLSSNSNEVANSDCTKVVNVLGGPKTNRHHWSPEMRKNIEKIGRQ